MRSPLVCYTITVARFKPRPSLLLQCRNCYINVSHGISFRVSFLKRPVTLPQHISPIVSSSRCSLYSLARYQVLYARYPLLSLGQSSAASTRDIRLDLSTINTIESIVNRVKQSQHYRAHHYTSPETRQLHEYSLSASDSIFGPGTTAEPRRRSRLQLGTRHEARGTRHEACIPYHKVPYYTAISLS